MSPTQRRQLVAIAEAQNGGREGPEEMRIRSRGAAGNICVCVCFFWGSHLFILLFLLTFLLFIYSTSFVLSKGKRSQRNPKKCPKLQNRPISSFRNWSNWAGQPEVRTYLLRSTFYVLRSTFYVLRSTFYVLRSTFYDPRWNSDVNHPSPSSSCPPLEE